MIVFQNGNVEVCARMMFTCFHSVIWVVGKMPGLYGKGEFSRLYSSAEGVPENVGWLIVVFTIVFFTYVAYKLNKGSGNNSSTRKKK